MSECYQKMRWRSVFFSNWVCNFLRYAVNKIGNCYRLVPLHIDKLTWYPLCKVLSKRDQMRPILRSEKQKTLVEVTLRGFSVPEAVIFMLLSIDSPLELTAWQWPTLNWQPHLHLWPFLPNAIRCCVITRPNETNLKHFTITW